jgi:hypothetical protein
MRGGDCLVVVPSAACQGGSIEVMAAGAVAATCHSCGPAPEAEALSAFRGVLGIWMSAYEA